MERLRAGKGRERDGNKRNKAASLKGPSLAAVLNAIYVSLLSKAENVPKPNEA
jgi:hypothetical protein